MQIADSLRQFPEGGAKGTGNCKALLPGVHLDRHMTQKRHHDIVDINQFQLPVRIVDDDIESAGDVVAEGRDDGVVVGARPFSKEIGQPVNSDSGPRASVEVRQYLFGPSLLRP